MKKILIPALILAVLCSPGYAQDDDFDLDAEFPELQVQAVRAQLVPLQKGVFSAGISAIIARIYVQEGQAVKVGAPLLRFDCDQLEASRSIAKARLESAAATLKVNQELLRLNSVGPLEVQLNKAELDAAQGELNLVQARLKHCSVLAPFDGVVTARLVEPHQFVAEGDTMLELVSRTDLEVRMLMPSTALSWLKPGEPFAMLVEELDTSMPGEIVRIGGAVDPVSLTVHAFGKLRQSDQRLLPGMSGQVRFTGAGQPGQ